MGLVHPCGATLLGYRHMVMVFALASFVPWPRLFHTLLGIVFRAYLECRVMPHSYRWLRTDMRLRTHARTLARRRAHVRTQAHLNKNGATVAHIKCRIDRLEAYMVEARPTHYI